MAQPVATLLIEMAADVARLRSDMGQAQKTVGDAMKGIQSTVDGARNAFGFLAAAIGVGSFTAFIKGSIDAADKLDEMSERTGVAASELSRLEIAFKLSGAGSDVMEKAFIKLNGTMNTNAKAIEQLGVATKNTDGSLRSSTAVLRDVADRFAGMEDGARKSALAGEIFGEKLGPQLAGMLNLGSEGLDEMAKLTEQLGMAMTDEGAAAAAQFNDTLDFLQTAFAGVARQATADLLPSLTNLASALLKTATETDVLKRVGELLGVVLKSLFTVVMSVAEALNSVATIATATWRAFMAATSGDFSSAVDIIKKAGSDVSSGWAKTSEIIKGAWDGSAQAAVNATATLMGQARLNQDAALQTAEAQKEMEAATKKAQAEFEKLSASLDKATIAAIAETDAGGKLTDAKKLELDIRAKLNDTTIRLTDSQRQEIESKLAAAQAALNDRDAQAAADEARKKLTETLGKEIEEIEKQIAAQVKANEEAGLTREQIARLEIQRLRDAAAVAEQTAQLYENAGINDEITQQYRQQADGLRKLADEREKGVHVQTAREAADEWKKTTESIENGLTDALMRAFESGKGFMEAFRQTLKNAFKTLVLEPTIRAIMGPISGALGGILGGAPGSAAAAAAGGGGGGMGLLGSIGSIAGIGGMLGTGLGYGLSAFAAGGMGLGATLSGAGAMISGGFAAGSLGSIAAGIGGVLGALGPIALGVGLLIKAFSRGPKQVTGTGIEGGFLGGEFSGQQYSEWMRKGGWFRSTKRGIDFNPLSQELKAQFDEVGATLFGAATEYGQLLGLPIEQLASVNYRVRVALTDDEKKNAAAIEQALQGYRNALAGAFARTLVPFQKAGEALADTLERLALLQGFSQDINQLGGIFSRIANLSVSAKEQLIGFAGGIESLVRQAQSFVQNYYTESERFGIAAVQLREQFQELGITGDISTRSQFRALVESTDISTEEGRKRLAALLALSESFAGVGAYLEQQGQTLSELAQQAPQTAILRSILDDSQAQAEYASRTANATERLFDGITDVGALIAAAIAGSTEAIERLREVMEAGQAAVIDATRQTNTILDSWDDNGAIVTTPLP